MRFSASSRIMDSQRFINISTLVRAIAKQLRISAVGIVSLKTKFEGVFSIRTLPNCSHHSLHMTSHHLRTARTNHCCIHRCDKHGVSHPLSGAVYSSGFDRTTATLRLLSLYDYSLCLLNNTHASNFTAGVREFDEFEQHRQLLSVC